LKRINDIEVKAMMIFDKLDSMTKQIFGHNKRSPWLSQSTICPRFYMW